MSDEHNWAELGHQAEAIGNFVNKLSDARRIFAAVPMAEAELRRLRGDIKCARQGAAEATAAQLQAEEDCERCVSQAEEKVEVAEARAAQAQQETESKRQALKAEEERDRAAFQEFKAELERDYYDARVAHEDRMRGLAEVEEEARASLARAEKQRQDMIAGLQIKGEEDAPKA